MKLNRTLVRAIEILELVSRKREGYTLAQLAEFLDSPKSSTFDIVKTLVYKNLLTENVQGGVTKYKIGLQSFLIGSSYINDIDIVNIAKPDLINLATQMSATTFIAVMDDYQVTYIYKYESEDSIITTANIGTRRSIHSAALGKSMVAFYSKELLDQAIKNTNFTPYTQYTITSIEEFLKELEQVRVKGYAVDNRENSLQQIAVAAPVMDYEGNVVASISCVGYYEKEIDLDNLGVIVKDVADKISRNLGYKRGN